MLSISLLLTACESNKEALARALAEQRAADQVAAAIEAGKVIPEIPADCRRKEASGVTVGERLDVALLKAERAIQRGNARIERCAAWQDEYREGRAK